MNNKDITPLEAQKRRFEKAIMAYYKQNGACHTPSVKDLFQQDRSGNYNTPIGFGAFIGFQACEETIALKALENNNE